MMREIQRPTPILSLILLLGSFDASASSGRSLHQQSALADVEVTDGIDQGEAMRIADVYYAVNSHCGSFNSVTDGGLV
jgi:hypothetical protein